MKLKAFKAYDIRGEWGTDLNEDIAYRIGYFLHRVLDVKTILVGRDMRLSSDTLFENLTRGITDSGVDVDDIGLSTTPMVYWSTARYGYDGSVMITASHNPKNHNGLKISKTNALPVGYDTGLNQLEAFVTSDEPCVPVAKRGVIRHKEVRDDYLAFQRGYTGAHDNLNIAVDCSSGMSSLFVHELIGKAHYINDRLDGTFPSHEPNPLEAASQEQIKALVKKERCDRPALRRRRRPHHLHRRTGQLYLPRPHHRLPGQLLPRTTARARHRLAGHPQFQGHPGIPRPLPCQGGDLARRKGLRRVEVARTRRRLRWRTRWTLLFP